MYMTKTSLLFVRNWQSHMGQAQEGWQGMGLGMSSQCVPRLATAASSCRVSGASECSLVETPYLEQSVPLCAVPNEHPRFWIAW